MEHKTDAPSTSRRLPDKWVGKIFQELQGNYGSRFLNQWKTGQSLPDGSDAGVRNAMNVWAEKLGGFVETPEVFGAVLASLPEDPPALPAFVGLCRSEMLRLRDVQQKIAHKLTPEEEEHNRQMAAQALKSAKADREKDFLDWAKRPRSRLAFAEVKKLAATDLRFADILADLVTGGVSDGQSLLKVWNCDDWVPA